MPYFALLGFLGITFHQWLQSNALQTSEASTAAWIVSTAPVFMALLGWIVLKGKTWLDDDHRYSPGVRRRITRGLQWKSRFDIASQFRQTRRYFGLIQCSQLGGGLRAFTARVENTPGRVDDDLSHVVRLAVHVHLFFATQNVSEIDNLTFNNWMGVAFLGVFCSGLAYIAWYDALKELSTAQTGAFLYIEPLVAVVVAAIVLAEQVTWASLLGGALILFGVWLVNRPTQ